MQCTKFHIHLVPSSEKHCRVMRRSNDHPRIHPVLKRQYPVSTRQGGRPSYTDFRVWLDKGFTTCLDCNLAHVSTTIALEGCFFFYCIVSTTFYCSVGSNMKRFINISIKKIITLGHVIAYAKATSIRQKIVTKSGCCCFVIC